MSATPAPALAGSDKPNQLNGRVILQLKDVHTYYGHIHALQGISLEVREGEVVTLLGSNGAGKTTTLKTIHGLLHPREGSIEFEGAEVSRLPAHELVRRGIGQSPEGRRIFGRMTVLENLQMGAFSRRERATIDRDYARVFELFPRLQERRTQTAGTLSGGEQQMLAIGRALMARPKLLLLDEPSMGLAPILVEQIFSIIRDINRQGTTILLVEQNALMALGVADRGYVLQTGRIVRSGKASALLEDEEVRKAYLGG
jgi:branched-chain amino acid transport system ATP-binding protein